MVLLAAYEEFTRKESVSLREENIEHMLKIQGKKAKVVAELETLRDEVEEAETVAFNRRVAALLLQEEENGKLLAAKIASNRIEFRKLSRSSVSASKFKQAYAAPIDRSAVHGSLKDRA